MGFNSGFKGLILSPRTVLVLGTCHMKSVMPLLNPHSSVCIALLPFIQRGLEVLCVKFDSGTYWAVKTLL